MTAQSAFGASFWLDNDAGTLTKISNVLTVSPPGKSREAIDSTDHDSAEGVAEYIGSGVVRLSAMTITIHRIVGSAVETLVYGALDAPDARTFKVLEPIAGGDPMATSGECIVTGYEPDAGEIEGKRTATITVQPTGPITQAVED